MFCRENIYTKVYPGNSRQQVILDKFFYNQSSHEICFKIIGTNSNQNVIIIIFFW